MWEELNPMWHQETVQLRIPIYNYRHLLNNHKCNNQSKRSTMSALSAMQEEWTRNTENKLKTGVLLWDLSAAYDMVNPSLFCEKAKFDELTCKWFLSFLTG